MGVEVFLSRRQEVNKFKDVWEQDAEEYVTAQQNIRKFYNEELHNSVIHEILLG